MQTQMCGVFEVMRSRRSAAGKQISQTVHLFAPSKSNEVVRHRPIHPARTGRDIPGEQRQSADDIRRLHRLIRGAKDLPDGMAAEEVIDPAALESGADQTLRG